MKSKSAEKIKLTSYDDLFGSSEVTAEEKIVSVPIRLFHTFKDHPFRVLDDEKMQETVESVKRYVLEMSVEEGSRYYTIENEQNLNADNIFRNGNKIFWMPDGMNSINFRDQDGNVIKIPETDSSTLNIEVCNYDGKMVERITLILERRDGQCSVEMLKK